MTTKRLLAGDFSPASFSRHRFSNFNWQRLLPVVNFLTEVAAVTNSIYLHGIPDKLKKGRRRPFFL
jgi:hypothetical protein